MVDAILKVEGVSHVYENRFTALKEINLTIKKGETFAVIGANGSGKTTLLKILDGLIFPTSGKVSAYGRILNEEELSGELGSFFRERVGFVFSEPDVQLFSPTVWDEVAFAPLQTDLPGNVIKERVEEVLQMLGLASLRDRAPYTLSRGEKKKVAIASVLSINPEVFILDEPTSGLDPRTQVWLIELMTRLRELKKTIIMATHDLSIVEDLADKVVVLSEGHTTVAHGTPEKIMNDKELLLSANLIHKHAHRHGKITHTHSHGTFSIHDDHK